MRYSALFLLLYIVNVGSSITEDTSAALMALRERESSVAAVPLSSDTQSYSPCRLTVNGLNIESLEANYSDIFDDDEPFSVKRIDGDPNMGMGRLVGGTIISLLGLMFLIPDNSMDPRHIIKENMKEEIIAGSVGLIGGGVLFSFGLRQLRIHNRWHRRFHKRFD